MEWFIALVAVIVIGVAAVASSGRLGEFTAAPTDRPEPQWPQGPLSSTDIDELGFAVVPRGYAMDQVDEFCERVKARLEELEGAAGYSVGSGSDYDPYAEPRDDDYDSDDAFDTDEAEDVVAVAPPRVRSYAGSVVSPLRSRAPGARRLSAWR